MKFDNSYNWVKFSHDFLSIARIGCQELLDKHHNKITFRSSKNLKYNEEDIFISIIFNIKHGIEIFIKSLKLILSDKLERNDKQHNITELFVLLKNEIQKNKIIEVIKKEYSKNPSDINLELAYNKKLKIPNFLGKLEKLIEKYHHCEILKDKLEKDFTIEDIDNTAFRYPENNLKINIDYQSVLARVTNEDIREVLEDVDTLLKNFNELGFVLDVYRRHKNKI